MSGDGARPAASRAASTRKLTFQWEHFRAIAPEVLKLWRLHYDEIALDKDICPLDPDWEQYFVQDELGFLHVLTARAKNGKLAGYIFNMVGTHKHYNSTMWGCIEMFWLHPYFRQGWQPVSMFKENLRGLKERGCLISQVTAKTSFENGRVAKLLYRLGYRATDIIMRKVL